jgi:GPH family glycoside/pentoside/hexuronide:cation symporter
LTQKLIGAVTIAFTGSLLAATGYVQATASVTQPQSAIDAIRLLSGLLPAAFFAAGIVLCHFYPLTRERHSRMLVAIERKRALRKRFAKQ